MTFRLTPRSPAAAAILSTLLFLFSLSATDAQSIPNISVESFGIAIGGNVANSTIIAGIPQADVEKLVGARIKSFQDLTNSQRETISLLQEKLSLNERQTYAALQILGEGAVPAERIAAKLVEMALRFREIEASLKKSPADDGEMASLKAQARNAIVDGDLAFADHLLQEVEAREKAVARIRALMLAETIGQRGKIAETQLDYKKAAAFFTEAADVLPTAESYREERAKYLALRAKSLYEQGRDLGDVPAAKLAVEQWRELLRSPGLSPAIQNEYILGLSSGLMTLTVRDGNRDHLREAAALLKQTISSTDDIPPLQAVYLKIGLAICLMHLGMLDLNRDTAREAAQIAYDLGEDKALQDIPQGRLLQSFVYAVALVVQAGVSRDRNSLEKGIVTMREVVSGLDAGFPGSMNTAQAHAFFSVMLMGWGRPTGDKAVLKEAVSHSTSAVELCQKSRLRMDCALMQMTKSSALLAFGDSTRDVGTLESAVATARSALTEITAARSPIDWVIAQSTLGNSLLSAARLTKNKALAEQARQAFSDALTMQSQLPYATNWTQLKEQLAAASALADSRKH